MWNRNKTEGDKPAPPSAEAEAAAAVHKKEYTKKVQFVSRVFGRPLSKLKRTTVQFQFRADRVAERIGTLKAHAKNVMHALQHGDVQEFDVEADNRHEMFSEMPEEACVPASWGRAREHVLECSPQSPTRPLLCTQKKAVSMARAQGFKIVVRRPRMRLRGLCL